MRGHIMILDDSQTILEYVEGLLAPAGFRVTTSTNPLFVVTRLEDAHPDLLLVDLDMPWLKGLSLVDALQRFDTLPETKIVLYSGACSQDELERLARESGVAGAIPKSTPREELIKQIAAFVEQTRP